MRLKRPILIVIIILCIIPIIEAQDQERVTIIQLLQENLNIDDYSIIDANVDSLSNTELQQIHDFMIDSEVIADSKWFDVSEYDSWEEYNFYRPINVQVITLLGRRDLFLDPARQLNNSSLTNMSDEALAALTFSQVYVEETWDQEPPWDGDTNTQFNWVHPDLLQTPSIIQFAFGDFIYQERVGYHYATYWSSALKMFNYLGIGNGTDEQLILEQLDYQAPRLAGYAYPLGNQLYLGTAETVYWFTDYLEIGNGRYSGVETQVWDTHIEFQFRTRDLRETNSANSDSIVLWKVLNAPFARQLRIELTYPETASFWNTMRYIHAAARQREGGASETYPENGQPPLIALRYDERTEMPHGRLTSDISAFAILTTVYSDSILLDFTNWNTQQNTLVVTPTDINRSDSLHRMVSERNKAILVIEHMGDENVYPNATHITGSRGLGFHLNNQYDFPETGDFLPYTLEESYALVMALTIEARDYQLEASRITLCNSPLLRRGYEAYTITTNSDATWSEIASGLCTG